MRCRRASTPCLCSAKHEVEVEPFGWPRTALGLRCMVARCRVHTSAIQPPSRCGLRRGASTDAQAGAAGCMRWGAMGCAGWGACNGCANGVCGCKGVRAQRHSQPPRAPMRKLRSPMRSSSRTRVAVSPSLQCAWMMPMTCGGGKGAAGAARIRACCGCSVPHGRPWWPEGAHIIHPLPERVA